MQGGGKNGEIDGRNIYVYSHYFIMFVSLIRIINFIGKADELRSPCLIITVNHCT